MRPPPRKDCRHSAKSTCGVSPGGQHTTPASSPTPTLLLHPPHLRIRCNFSADSRATANHHRRRPGYPPKRDGCLVLVLRHAIMIRRATRQKLAVDLSHVRSWDDLSVRILHRTSIQAKIKLRDQEGSIVLLAGPDFYPAFRFGCRLLI